MGNTFYSARVCSLNCNNNISSYSCEPIHESFRFMIGRNASAQECAHYQNVIFSGVQVAHGEPYINTTDKPRNKDYTCTAWGGTTSAGKNETITETNADDIARRGGKSSSAISAILRTITCNMPSDDVVRMWTGTFESNLFEVATEMLEYYEPKFLCWDAIDDVYSRTLGHLPITTDCDTTNLTTTPPASDNSDCYWLWALSRGEETIHDINHHSRSTAEYMAFNEAATCQQQYPMGSKPQENPHAVGEYVAQIFRIVLGRRPTKREMKDIIDGYEGGDTRQLLLEVVEKLTTAYCS